MPYCSTCGLFYEENDLVCPNCTPEGTDEINFTDPSRENSEANVSNIEPTTYHRPVESQLGKGIIRPCSSEIGSDGVHFKYDEPPQPISRPENLINKTTEYRVTVPDEEPIPDSNEIETPAPIIDESPDETPSVTESDEVKIIDLDSAETVETPPIEQPDEIDSTTVETVSEPSEPEESPGDNVPDAAEEQPAPEPIEPENPPSPEIVWQGIQKRFGLFTCANYILTTNSLEIRAPKQNQTQVIDLSQVSQVIIKQPWWQKIFNIGDLVLLNRINQPEWVIRDITNLPDVKETIEKLLLTDL